MTIHGVDFDKFVDACFSGMDTVKLKDYTELLVLMDLALEAEQEDSVFAINHIINRGYWPMRKPFNAEAETRRPALVVTRDSRWLYGTISRSHDLDSEWYIYCEDGSSRQVNITHTYQWREEQFFEAIKSREVKRQHVGIVTETVNPSHIPGHLMRLALSTRPTSNLVKFLSQGDALKFLYHALVKQWRQSR